MITEAAFCRQFLLAYWLLFSFRVKSVFINICLLVSLLEIVIDNLLCLLDTGPELKIDSHKACGSLSCLFKVMTEIYSAYTT